MLIEHPNHKELTPEELQSLKQLHTVIDRAIADGKVSKYEMELIERTMRADGKVLVEEVTMIRQLLQEQFDSGLLVRDWNN